MAKTQTEMRTVGYNFVVKYFFHLPILVYMLFFFELRIKFLDLSMHVATLNQVLVASVIKSYVVAWKVHPIVMTMHVCTCMYVCMCVCV